MRTISFDPAAPLPLTRETPLEEAVEIAKQFFSCRQRQLRREIFAKLLNGLVKQLGPKRQVGTISVADIAAMCRFHLKEGHHVRSRLFSYAQFFKLLHEEGAIAANPVAWRRLPLPPRTIPNRRAFTFEEYQAVLLEGSKSDIYAWYWPTACMIAWHTGLRRADVATLRWTPSDELGASWVDFDQEIIFARPHKKEARREYLTIPLDPELYDHLKALYARRDTLDTLESPYVMFDMKRDLTPYGDNCSPVKYQFRKICDRAGLPDLSFHSFRHAFVTRMVAAGVSNLVISSLTGQTLQTIQQYAHISQEQKVDALRLANKCVHEAKLRKLGLLPEVIQC